jgi:hypothetical protein
MAFRTGDRVLQHHYGLGVIIDMYADHVTIAFDNGPARKFVAGRVQLQASLAPPPPRLVKPRPRRKSNPGHARPAARGKVSAS